MVKVLVCGTNYGRIYLEALKLAGSKYTLAGILGRGSSRSRQVAKAERVTLYRSVRDLPDDIELACVAVGSSGIHVVFDLLRRGIHVLCEHPLKAGEVRRALESARHRRTVFHINGHFADLETIAPFHRTCKELRAAQPAIAVDLTVVDRSLYGGLDIIRRCLDPVTPFEFRHTGRNGPFEHLAGTAGGTPIAISVQTPEFGRDAPFEDGSPEYLTDFRITAFFAKGVLTILSMAGPVIWNNNCNRAAAPESSMYELLSPPGISRCDVQRIRVAANLHAIDRLHEQVRTGTIAPEQQPERLVEVAQWWETTGGLLKDRAAGTD